MGSWRGGRGAGRRGAGASAAEPATAALAAEAARRMRGPRRRPRRSVQLGTAPPPPRRIWAAGSRHRCPEPFKDPSFGCCPAHLVLARGCQPQPFTDLSAAATSERGRHFRALKLGCAFSAAPSVLQVKFITQRWSFKDRERHGSEGFV